MTKVLHGCIPHMHSPLVQAAAAALCHTRIITNAHQWHCASLAGFTAASA